jgi:hypothetical protein
VPARKGDPPFVARVIIPSCSAGLPFRGGPAFYFFTDQAALEISPPFSLVLPSFKAGMPYNDISACATGLFLYSK